MRERSRNVRWRLNEGCDDADDNIYTDNEYDKNNKEVDAVVPLVFLKFCFHCLFFLSLVFVLLNFCFAVLFLPVII